MGTEKWRHRVWSLSDYLARETKGMIYLVEFKFERPGKKMEKVDLNDWAREEKSVTEDGQKQKMRLSSEKKSTKNAQPEKVNSKAMK